MRRLGWVTAWLGLSAQVSLAAERITPPPISSDQYEASPAFTPDGREVYFMRADKSFQNYRLFMSRCENGAWTAPVPPPFAAPAPVLEADPFITADGKRLYFISSRHAFAQGRGHDDLDIWKVERQSDGRWGMATRMPEPINSPTSELLPRETADGRLVFGSARLGGFGGSDIYFASRDGGSWKVLNAGAQVNTDKNEYEAEISRDMKTLIVVSDREERSRLYRYTLSGQRWSREGRIEANDAVFQVGPLLSPKADRLLFAQADGERSGEWFVTDLTKSPDLSWPPACGKP